MIEQIYKRKYVGHIKIKRLCPIGLMVTLGMNNDDKPLVIAADLNDEDYLKFFCKELHERGLNVVKYFKGVKTYPGCSKPIDTRCGCHTENTCYESDRRNK